MFHPSHVVGWFKYFKGICTIFINVIELKSYDKFYAGEYKFTHLLHDYTSI
tara:strand:+ start:2091 stop:2243 length:153 start_codon:yes stop_codon:yes gene_type:complete